MELLVIILNREEYLDDVLTLFLELGVTGATIIDSVGMGRIISENIPIFAAFRDMMSGARPRNKTIFTVLPDMNKVKEIVKKVQDVVGSFQGTGNGFAFSIPVNFTCIEEKCDDLQENK